jgi:hypothetical protein
MRGDARIDASEATERNATKGDERCKRARDGWRDGPRVLCATLNRSTTGKGWCYMTNKIEITAARIMVGDEIMVKVGGNGLRVRMTVETITTRGNEITLRLRDPMNGAMRLLTEPGDRFTVMKLSTYTKL